MKGRILITALALVLALGGLIVINRVEAAKALPVEMEVVNSISDSSAALPRPFRREPQSTATPVISDILSVINPHTAAASGSSAYSAAP